ncbi:MAG: transglutaminase-like domain-containing protein [archaeon]
MNKKVILLVLAIVVIAFGGVLSVNGNLNAEPVLENKMTAYAVTSQWDENKENWSVSFDELMAQCNFNQVMSPQKDDVLAEDAEIRNLATGLCAGAETDIEKIYKLHEFTSNISYLVYSDWRNASDVLETGAGDCTDKSVLLVSMLRAMGIESYIVYGGALENDTHAWVVARVDNAWLQLDPTVSDFDFVYKCLDNEECEYKEYYGKLRGMFNDATFLECK